MIILDEDQFSRITNIFCAEVDKPTNAQRQVFDNENPFEQLQDTVKRTNQSESTRQNSETVEEGKITHDFFIKKVI